MPHDSDLDTPGFSPKTAYYLARASEAAYAAVLADATADLALDIAAVAFPAGELTGFLGGVGAHVVVVLRGTANVENWLTDGRIPQVDDPAYPGLVHQGFAEAMELLWPGLRDQLPDPEPDRPVWVTGHSLGGALATLAAVRLEAEGYNVRAVYTFGSPRVGDPEFYRAYSPQTYRFVNNNDVVPHVPVELMLLGVLGIGLRRFDYKHVGTLKYLDRHGRLGEGMSEWSAKKEFLLGLLALTNGTPDLEAVADHQIANYVTAIGSNL